MTVYQSAIIPCKILSSLKFDSLCFFFVYFLGEWHVLVLSCLQGQDTEKPTKIRVIGIFLKETNIVHVNIKRDRESSC